MNRREFSRALAGAAGAAGLAGWAPRAAAGAAQVGAEAHALYERALILDCNSGPPDADHLPLPRATLDMVRDSGIDVIKFSLGGINGDFAATVGEIAMVQRLVEVHPDYFMQVRVVSDMARAQRERKLGIILSFESADMLGGKLAALELFRNLGVRVMQLSYNKTSAFAAGVMAPTAGGLTPLGREAVKEMNRLGIAVDLSHANAATTAEALRVSGKPPVMTHAGCAAVHAHPRTKSDEQLRALAARGGVVGIFDLPYLTASPRQPTVADYMAHLEHALKIAGEDHVGIGSDVGIEPFDTSPKGMAEFAKEEARRQAAGLAAPEEDRPTYVEGLNVPRRIEIIADQLLKRGYSARVTEKVVGGNFARVFGEIWSV
ncbi:MAG TPA: membrane dipeptidase [Steroidobacteraceae bacterium]|nr:membrane dipeptidase [Steroidobacteraceae bacterium]